MADKAVMPRITAVNAPATTAAALSTLAARIVDAIGVERALEQRYTPRLRNDHEDGYEALHAALADLSGASELDGVTRFGADISRQIVFFMLSEDARDQEYSLDHTIRFLELAIGCETAGFGDAGIKDSLRQIRTGLETLSLYHRVSLSDPDPEIASGI